MNEVSEGSTVKLDGKCLPRPYLSPLTPAATEACAQRIGREGTAALGCGCGMVPGFTSRPRGGAWLASLPKSVINKASAKAFVLGTFFCPLGINVWEGTTAELLPQLIFLLPPGWFAVPSATAQDPVSSPGP